MTITVLPSVRAIKLLVAQNCETTCHNSQTTSSGCEKGKIVMNLNFSPSQFVPEISLKNIILIPAFYSEKEKSNYEKIFISHYYISIWQPPKIINLV
jgi:hypothetical protein